LLEPAVRGLAGHPPGVASQEWDDFESIPRWPSGGCSRTPTIRAPLTCATGWMRERQYVRCTGGVLGFAYLVLAPGSLWSGGVGAWAQA
jgi:hypothetical protein